MSLAGLFAALSSQIDTPPPASFPSQGEGESLLGLGFLNELAALLADPSDLDGSSGEGGELTEPSADLPDEPGRAALGGGPQPAAAPSEQSSRLSPRAADAVSTSAKIVSDSSAAPSETVVEGNASSSSANGIGETDSPTRFQVKAEATASQQVAAAQQTPVSQQAPASQKAATSQDAPAAQASKPTQEKHSAARPPAAGPQEPALGNAGEGARIFNGGDGLRIPGSGDLSQGGEGGLRVPAANDPFKGSASLPTPEPAATAEVKAVDLPLGRRAELRVQLQASEPSPEPPLKLPPDLLRLVQSGQQESGQRPFAPAARPFSTFVSLFAPSAAPRPAAQAPPPAGPDPPTSATIDRGAADKPQPETDPHSQAEGGFDPYRQRKAGLRFGASSNNPAAFSQPASSGARFADLLQNQAPSVQPGLPASQVQVARAMPTAAPESFFAETATVHGQEADQVFSQVVQNARLLRSPGETRFEIRLKPEFLGKIQIETQLQADRKMTTRLLVEDPEVRALLESRLPLLAERLGESGVRIGSLEVQSMNSQGGNESSRFAADSGGGNRQQQGSSGKAAAGSPSNRDEEGSQGRPQPGRRRLGGIHLVA